ncbi:MAG: hypothetical protein AB3N23_18555 [Paracoccaceae bacterium]
MTFTNKFLALVLAAGFAVSMLQPAQAGNESRYEAFALNDGTFEVVAEFTENAIYWCGASLFARTRLGQATTQRIYVLQPPGPSRAKPGYRAVRFGLAPPAGAENVSSLTNSVGIVGNSLSVAQAYGGCSERSSSG